MHSRVVIFSIPIALFGVLGGLISTLRTMVDDRPMSVSEFAAGMPAGALVGASVGLVLVAIIQLLGIARSRAAEYPIAGGDPSD